MIETVVDANTGSAQLTKTVLMVSPDRFGFNPETALTNSFQNNPDQISPAEIRDKAISEFRSAVETLDNNGLKTIVISSRIDAVTPDAVFPNNWISFHSELPNVGVVLYPMLAPNRRAERQFANVIAHLPWMDLDPARILDLTNYEDSGHFLEGTGSLIFDRKERVVFAHESPRTSTIVLDAFCEQTGYRQVKFHAFDTTDRPIYHTNVVMSIGDGFSVIALESIRDRKERQMVEQYLKDLNLEILDISLPQVNAFCGNILEVKSIKNKPKIILSTTAYAAFTKTQREKLAEYGDLMQIDIPTIEKVGGGSARCMLAEVFPT